MYNTSLQHFLEVRKSKKNVLTSVSLLVINLITTCFKYSKLTWSHRQSFPALQWVIVFIVRAPRGVSWPPLISELPLPPPVNPWVNGLVFIVRVSALVRARLECTTLLVMSSCGASRLFVSIGSSFGNAWTLSSRCNVFLRSVNRCC